MDCLEFRNQYLAFVDQTLPIAEQLQESGMFKPPVPVPDDAPLQTRLLALFGRRA